MHAADVWVRPAQAVYLLLTGDLPEARRLTDDAIIGMAVLVPSTSVPLLPDAPRKQRVAALKRIKELASKAGESPFSIATQWRDDLLATGQVPAVGRSEPDGQLQSIMPAEFAAGLRLIGPHAVSSSGQLAFYDVRLSGAAVLAARQAALEASSPGVTDQPSNLSQFMLTGAPGRPSKGMHLVRIEFERRRETQQCKLTLREEATELANWFRSSYPDRQAVSRKTIENNIRSDYHKWRKNRPSPEL